MKTLLSISLPFYFINLKLKNISIFGYREITPIKLLMCTLSRSLSIFKFPETLPRVLLLPTKRLKILTFDPADPHVLPGRRAFLFWGFLIVV